MFVVALRHCVRDHHLSSWIRNKEPSSSGMVVKRTNITELPRKKLLTSSKKGGLKCLLHSKAKNLLQLCSVNHSLRPFSTPLFCRRRRKKMTKKLFFCIRSLLKKNCSTSLVVENFKLFCLTFQR